MKPRISRAMILRILLNIIYFLRVIFSGFKKIFDFIYRSLFCFPLIASKFLNIKCCKWTITIFLCVMVFSPCPVKAFDGNSVFYPFEYRSEFIVSDFMFWHSFTEYPTRSLLFFGIEPNKSFLKYCYKSFKGFGEFFFGGDTFLGIERFLGISLGKPSFDKESNNPQNKKSSRNNDSEKVLVDIFDSLNKIYLLLLIMLFFVGPYTVFRFLDLTFTVPNV